jgi:uncharacterized protein YggE
MRKLVIAAWAVLGSVLLAVPAAADSPVSLPPLAPGEVLLEVNAFGVARSPATSATLTARISRNAASEEEVRSNVAAAVAQITAAARAAGVPAADIVASPVSTDRSLGSDFYNSADMDLNAVDSMDHGAGQTYYASSGVTIALRSPAAAAALRRTVAAIDGVEVESSTTTARRGGPHAAKRSATPAPTRKPMPPRWGCGSPAYCASPSGPASTRCRWR